MVAARLVLWFAQTLIRKCRGHGHELATRSIGSHGVGKHEARCQAEEDRPPTILEREAEVNES